MVKGGTWETVAFSKEDLFSGAIRVSDAYGMTMTQAQRALAWAQRNGWRRAKVTKRNNGSYGVALN